MPTLSELTLGVFADDVYAALAATLTLSTHPHPRARIRDWIVQRLRAGALQPDRIRPTRGTPTALSDLPALFVYTLNEPESEEYDESPRRIARSMTLSLLAVVPEANLPTGVGMDDVLDAFARVAEILLLNDRGHSDGSFFGGEAANCALGDTSIELEDSGDRLLIYGRVSFTVTYQDEITVPVTGDPVDIHVDYDLGPTPDGQIEATDEIDIAP